VFMIVSDDDGHTYVIPEEKDKEWFAFVEDPNYGYIDEPEWARRINGKESIRFPSYEDRT